MRAKEFTQGVVEGREQDYLSQIPNLTWKPVNRSVWNTIQDEGLDEEQNAPNHSDWLMASLPISPKDAQALQAFDDNAIEDFNRFDIHLKSRYPGLTDLIDYDRGTVTIVKTAKEQDVTEAPLPPDWDKEQLNLRQTFKNRIKYALSKAQKIGTGSSRVAFIIPYEGRNTVLKVAKNLKGLAQNEAELEILNDYVLGQSEIVIPLIDYDKANKRPVWIQTELASQISMKPLLQLLRTPKLWFLTDAVKYRLSLPDKPKYLNKPADLKEKYFDPKMWTYGGQPTEQNFEMFNEYVDKIAELKDSSQLELGDLQNNLNWGQFMGRPVVIDLGLSSEVWQKLYKV